MKVLVVDDSIAIQQIIKDQLSNENFDIETADNGAEALAKYAKFRPDVVTLDVTMPLMDGYEALSKILNFDKNAKVIMLTTLENWSLIERCLARGAVGYISKPFGREELINTIQNPWHYEHKNIVTLFSITCNKLQNSLQKIFSSDVNIVLNKIETSDQQVKSQSTDILSTIIAVSGTQEKTEIKIPSTSIGFINEFTGQMHGLIFSHMNQEYIKKLLTKSSFGDINKSDATKEFFHIINTKFFSTMCDITGHILNAEVTQQYDDSTKLDSFQHVIKGKYDIIVNNIHFPMETQLLSNAHLTYTRRM